MLYKGESNIKIIFVSLRSKRLITEITEVQIEGYIIDTLGFLDSEKIEKKELEINLLEIDMVNDNVYDERTSFKTLKLVLG